jgi:hypothetical protein
VNIWGLLSDQRLTTILVDLAAVATVLGGAIAVSQLIRIATELGKKPDISIRVDSRVIEPWNGTRALVLVEAWSTNRGARTAHNMLWNYVFPAGCALLDEKGGKVHHQDSGLVVVRTQDHLHPEVAVLHSIGPVIITLIAPTRAEPDALATEMRCEWTLNLQDEKPRRAVFLIPLL